MGGYGSGRWRWHSKKDIVEDCRILDVNRWTREGILRVGVQKFGGWRWCHHVTGEESSSIGYELNTTEMAFSWVRLYYTFTRTQEQVDYTVMLQTTPLYSGGIRWWFTCPLKADGRSCLRRISKLYLPPGGRYFGCRHCYNLTYQSAQEHDTRIDFYRKHPEALMAALERIKGDRPDCSKALLALKAMKWRA
jgi:hypothetical protein